MDETNSEARSVTETFREIINIQTDVAKLGVDLGGVMRLVADRLLDLTHADAVIVELAEDEEMVYRAAAGTARNQLGLRLARHTSLSGLCIAKGELLVCEDTELDDRVDREACRRVGFRSMAVTPLVHEGEPVGVVKIGTAQPAALGPQDIEILGLMTGMIGAAIFHASRFEADALYKRATRDPLTGLANRALFYDRLRQSLSQARRDGSQVGLLNLDMDGLKVINDSYGHRAGDAALCELANRLTRQLRRSDTLARLGGDEFAVIMPRVEGRQAAQAALERIAEDMAPVFDFEAQSLAVQASIGAAIFPDDGCEIEDLVEAADRAMYAVKRRRHGRTESIASTSA
jgi:diguanylate cyclase (GGDEF)-like protein